jgi:hypothetical protein
VASLLDEALNSQNPTGRLHSEALRCMLSAGRELKTEISAERACLRTKQFPANEGAPNGSNC